MKPVTRHELKIFEFAISLCIFTEMRMEMRERVDKRSGWPDYYYDSFCLCLNEDIEKLERYFSDRRFVSKVGEYIFKNVVFRMERRSGKISCSNCERFFECKLGPIVKSGKVVKGGFPALESFFVKEAEKCNSYVPSDDLTSVDYWRRYAETLRDVCEEVGLKFSETFYSEIVKYGEKVVNDFLSKMRNEKDLH